jgi:Excreted virulence factor EspC, type VII ESX diderm
MTEDLRVDTGLVREAGGRLAGIAAGIPDPPPAHSPSGGDALSTAIAGKVAEVVDPVIAQMPVAKEELMRYAQNVVNAAGTYDAVDRQIADEILKRLEQFDQTVGEGGGSGGGATGGSSGAPGAASSVAGGASSAAGAAQQAGQMGQMMQMPMQMAQQATQAPMQMAAMASAIPQAMQQAGQTSEMAGKGESKPQETGPSEKARDSASPHDGSAAGSSGGERAPEVPRQDTSVETSPAPPPRATEPGPEIAL